MLQHALSQSLGYRWQFSGSRVLDEACLPFLAASDAAWYDAMVARWSANPLGMPWPEMDAAFVGSGGQLWRAASRAAADGRHRRGGGSAKAWSRRTSASPGLQYNSCE
jgi:hypothetical protein